MNLMPDNLPTAPVAEIKDSVLTIHEHTRVDPYFWMRLTDEQKNAEEKDEQTQKVWNYLEEENAYLKTVMSKTETLQTELFDEIVGRIKKDDESAPYFKNGYWYYSKYADGKEYPLYCRKAKTLDNPEEVYLDVNTLAEGYTYYAASGIRISPDNKILAFGEDTVSRRVYTMRFLNLETGEFLADEIPNCQAGGAWANDNRTFFYTTKNKVSLLSEKIWRHELATSLDEDVMVYHEKDPSYYIGVDKSKSDQYIIIGESSTLASDYQILAANNPKGEFRQFTPREDVHEYSIEHFEDKFYILTNKDAVNFRLMETPVNETNIENWKEVIPHREDVLLDGIELFKNYLVLSERSNALTHIRIINQTNKDEHYLEFDETAYVAYISTNTEFNTETLRFGYSSMTTPSSTIDYDMANKTKEVKKVQEVIGGHNPDEYITERLFAPARDGKKVPISLVYKKGLKKNGKAPLLLYAYGSYGATMDPWFSSTRLSLLDRGFVYAIAHIRGSQALGRHWYDDGKMMNKMNTFNDYIDVGQYLVKENYTTSKHMYAMGGSAGGLLMGAVVNMAPELFNGAIAAVPFVDVVSTMLDETIPLTTNEFDEWGNPKNKDAYDYMLSYSPYDNVEAKAYPHLLITTGLFDSQVQYWEPAKWIAKLRANKTDNNILMMHTNMEAGHGGASGRFKRYKETAMEYAFMIMLESQED
ncbi:S9 family peptidase [Marinilabiliaceae bacterium N1Y90]|nr:S9 family peptidase [Marinilabiliaceae bacterium N1Y90]